MSVNQSANKDFYQRTYQTTNTRLFTNESHLTRIIPVQGLGFLPDCVS